MVALKMCLVVGSLEYAPDADKKSTSDPNHRTESMSPSDDEEFAIDWIPKTWNRVRAIRPYILGTHSFRGIVNTPDLCDSRLNHGRTTCWEKKSKYQHSIVVDTGNFSMGKILYLDCEPQSSSADEFIYHESLVHPPMITHGNPKSVFIAGGGEGGTAREALRYKGVDRVMMVDLDDELVKLSKERLRYWEGVEDDPRLELVIGDAIDWLRNHDETYDVIIFDLPDCTKANPITLTL